jgi:uncharacterized protein YkwD
MRLLGGRLVLALALPVASMSVLAPAVAAPVGRPTAPPDVQLSTRQASPPPVRARALDLDPSDRESMRRGWLDVLRPALRTPIGWTGNLKTCTPGAPTAEAQDATLSAVNYFRDLVGVEPVTFSRQLNRAAQRAALMMARNRDYSHSPAEDWACSTAAGRDALQRSNLFLGRAGAGAVAGYMDDGGGTNTAVAHRRWLIDPRQTTMGSGSVDAPGNRWREIANALYVTDGASWQTPPSDTPRFMPWPVAGYVPRQIEPEGRWSLSIPDDDVDFSDAVVTVNGSTTGITRRPVATGYGPPTLVWDFDPGFHAGDADRDYAVTVSGMTEGDMVLDPISYTVTLFDAAVPPSTEVPPVVERLGRTFEVSLTGFTTSWRAEDPDGVAQVQVRDRERTPTSAYGSWSTGAWEDTDRSTTMWSPSEGSTTCESARAKDTAGNVSEWVAPPSCRHVPVDDSVLNRSVGWRTTSDDRLWNGSATTTTRKGATLSLPRVVEVDRLGVVASTCGGCGRVRVKVGARNFGVIDLSGPVDRRKVILRPGLLDPRSGTVKLVVLSSGKKVQIDGLVASQG